MTLSLEAQRFEQFKEVRLRLPVLLRRIGWFRGQRGGRLWCWVVFVHPDNPRIWF